MTRDIIDTLCTFHTYYLKLIYTFFVHYLHIIQLSDIYKIAYKWNATKAGSGPMHLSVFQRKDPDAQIVMKQEDFVNIKVSSKHGNKRTSKKKDDKDNDVADEKEKEKEKGKEKKQPKLFVSPSKEAYFEMVLLTKDYLRQSGEVIPEDEKEAQKDEPKKDAPKKDISASTIENLGDEFQSMEKYLKEAKKGSIFDDDDEPTTTNNQQQKPQKQQDFNPPNEYDQPSPSKKQKV